MSLPQAGSIGDTPSDEDPSSHIQAAGLVLHVIATHDDWSPASDWPAMAQILLNQIARHTELKGEASLLVSDDAKLQALNRQFRGRDNPTNILSFPDGTDGYIGDMALSLERVKAEAKAQNKPFMHHLLHLITHGLLHLAGHDHQSEDQARHMEDLERDILSRLAITDPYEDLAS